MKEYLHPNGFKYTEGELRGYAKQENLSFDEYLSAKNFKLVAVPDAVEVGGEPVLSPGGFEIIPLEESLKQLKQQSKSEQEAGNWQGFKNSISNLIEQVGDLGEFHDITGDEEEGTARSTADILSTTVNEAVFGKENILKWREEGGLASWIWEDYIPSHDESFIRQIESYKLEREKLLPTVNIKKAIEAGDAGAILSGIAGSIANVGGSVIYNLGTGGVGFLAEFASENIIEANTIKAEAQGKTLNEFIRGGGKLDLVRPLQIAAVQQGLEYIALSKLTKMVGGKNLVRSYGKKLSKKLSTNKNLRIGLDILSTGMVEAGTEMSQHGLTEYNKALATGKVTGEDVNFYEVMGDAMFSDEGIEAGLQGFFGGAGLKGGAYSAKAMNSIRKKVDAFDIEQDIASLITTRRKLAETVDVDLRDALERKIIKIEASINEKIKNGNKLYESLSDGDITAIENASDLADVAAFRINALNKKLNQGKITQEQYDEATDIFVEQYDNAAQSIKDIALAKSIEYAKVRGKELGKKVKVVKDNESAQKEYDKLKKQFKEKDRDVSGADGFILGDTIVINEAVARETGAISVGSHELLHGIIGNSFSKLSEVERTKLGKSFMGVLNSKQEAAVRKRLKRDYGLEGDAVFGTEEMFTAFSDAINKNEISFNENVFRRMGLAIEEVLRKLSEAGHIGKESFLYRKEFSNGRQVYNFLKDYQKGVKEDIMSERVRKFAEIDREVTGVKFAPSKTVESKIVKSELIDDKVFENKIQSLYEEGRFDEIQDAYKPRIAKILRAEWGWTENNEGKFNAVIEEAVGPDRGILQMIFGPGKTKYDPTRGVPLSGHIGSIMQKRGLSEYVQREYPKGVIEQQMGKESVAKEVAKIEAEPQDVILTEKVLEQYKTPLLSGLTFVKKQIKVLRDTVALVVGTRLQALDAAVSKNRSISPLVADMKAQLYVKNGPIHKMVYDIMSEKAETLTQEYLKKTNPKTKKLYTEKEAKNQAFKDSVEAFFKNPKYKKAVLESLTTTWLAKHLKKGVQKEVNGIGWTTDWIGRTKGTKKGQVNFWRMAEEGPYKGMTDGKPKIRRNPKIMDEITPAMLGSAFIKGETITDIKRGGLENISLAITQELGIETFKADMINDGALKKLFTGRQELFNRILDSNFVEEFVRQTERGTTKFSESKPVDSSLNKLINEELAKKINKQASYNNIVEIAGHKPINIETDAGRTEYLKFFVEKVVPLFPKKVLLAMSGTFARGDRIYDKITGMFVPEFMEKAWKAKYIFANKADFEYFLDQLEEQGIRFGINLTEQQETYMLDAVTRVGYGTVSKKTQQKKVTAKEQKASKKRGFKLIWKMIQDEIQADKNTIPGFAAMLSSSSQFQGHMMRTGAGVNFYNLLMGKNVEEHTSPITALGKFLFINAIAGNLFTGKVSTFDKVMKSYFQGSLPKFMDNRLKLKGPDGKMIYDYSSMPPIELLAGVFNGDISIWARYFHPNVNGNFSIDESVMTQEDIKKYKDIGGIDPNIIVLDNEQTVAKLFGIDIDSKLLTPQVIAAQQDLIYRQAIGEKISPTKIKNTLAGVAGVNFSKSTKNSQTMAKAINFSRSAKNPTRGMSAWDFDDTIARTKSGVRYTLPNSEGIPQPGRKVIFLAGAAGAGKSNVVKQLGLKDQGFNIVNSDISLEWLKKNSGLPADMKDLTHEELSKLGKLQYESRQIALRKKMKFQGKGDGIVVDGTGASLNVMKKQVQEFKDKGYDVQMVFTETSLETAQERNKARKGRSLFPKIVETTWKSVQGNKEAFQELFGKNFSEVNTDKLKQNDPMPAGLVAKVDKFTKGYIKGRLDAGEYADKGADLEAQGAEFDFAEFDIVVEGEKGPLFGKAIARAKKFGTKDQFILTARPHAAKESIHEFLNSQGLNIPLDNIITLESSTPESKSLWIADKVGEGYNDIYFADDALQNIQAVDNMLEQFDVKRRVQLAKRQRVEVETAKNKAATIKSELGDARNLGSPNDYNNIKFSKSHRTEYEKTLAKHRPDLVKDRLVSQTIDNMFIFIDSLNIPNDKKRKYERITTKWLATSNIKLLEDRFKITDAVNLAERFKLDLFSYNNPNEIIEAYAGKVKKKPLNPNKVKTFSPGRVLNKKHGLTVHDVEDTKEGMQGVRNIINSHWGENSNPWCISQAKNGKLTEDAWLNWIAYRKTKKQIVFQNGRLLGFYANGTFWDRMDNATDGPTVSIKKGRVTRKVELVHIDGKIEETVRETRTVSKDGNYVTTEIFADSQDGYAEGTKIVENRVKGITIKSTRYSPDGKVVEIVEFNKDGKGKASYHFFPDGRMSAVNTYGQPFGDMSVNEVVMKKGDLLGHEINESGIDYFSADILLDRKVIVVGWLAKAPFDLKNVIKTVDGKVRIDLKKVLEVDPDAKGLPKTGIKFSKSMNTEFNDILEEVTGIESKKRFSAIKARKRGADKGRFRFFIPPSHEDFVGLLYNFIGKGKKGDAHRNFFEETLIRPLNRTYRELNTAKQAIANDYKSLNKEFKNIKKKLTKKTPDGDFTFQDAIRVYLWDKHGHTIPGLNKTDQQKLVDLVIADSELQAYAETLDIISKQETYVKPSENWEAGDIRVDLDDATGRVGREQFFIEFFENADIIFSEENLNKIEAAYGAGVVSAIKDILYRTKTGRNRPSGGNAIVNGFMNYLNGSVASTMFFNTRSAVLQQMSMVNFINFADNNIYAAGKAFLNQEQYYTDWAYIFNSDFMKQRRRGIKTDVNGAELVESLRGAKNTPRALLAKLLELGFLPTQIGDNMAIATGGATFYRNRINTYLKQGLSQKEAESKAWIDFQILAEATQQSARPDMVSQQQASHLGKVILAFQNVTSQFNRLGKKAFLDIKNRRITPGNTTQFQSDISNLSRISYYFVIQNLIFYSLQSALFMAMFDDDEEDERWLKKKERVINGSIDSVLRGTGVWGAVIATLKNMAIKWHEQREKGYNADESAVLMEMLNVSPPLGIKARKLVNAEKTLNYNKDVIKDMETFDIDNPMWSAVTNYIEATTNAPLNRMYNKTQNVRQSLNNQNEALQRVLMLGGWSQWNLGIENERMNLIKEQLKLKKKLEKKKSRYRGPILPGGKVKKKKYKGAITP